MAGAVRLRGGTGTPCDGLHSGIVEVYRADVATWGAICTAGTPDDRLVADVVCRQLGFQYGTPETTLATAPGGSQMLPGGVMMEDRIDAGQPAFLSDVVCRGTEERIGECRDARAVAGGSGGLCMEKPGRLRVACRKFPVVEALESAVTPGAGTAVRTLCMHELCMHDLCTDPGVLLWQHAVCAANQSQP